MSSETSRNTPSADPLDTMRAEIDEYDEQILEIVRQRTKRSLDIAREKASRGIITLVPGRESQVIGNYLAAADDSEGLLARADAVRLGSLVMEISRTAQDNWRTAEAEAAAAERVNLVDLAAQDAADQLDAQGT